VLRAGDDRAIGRPPAHVAGALIEIAVDDIDRVQRQIDQPRALRLLGHQPGQAIERRDLAGELGIERRRNAADFGGYAAHFLRDDCEAAPRVAGALRLDHRVEREDLGAAGDLRSAIGGGGRDVLGELDDPFRIGRLVAGGWRLVAAASGAGDIVLGRVLSQCTGRL
jgi:hypothetical protein